jgi:glyoxylate reductase
MAPRVLITHKLAEEAVDVARQSCEVHFTPLDQPLDAATLRQAVAGMDGLISVVTDTIDTALLQAGPDLKVVANVAAGYDNVDVPAATRHGVVVTNTPGVVTESTADLTWGLLFGIGRRVTEADRYVRAGKWKEWRLMVLLGHDVHGGTLGIIGMGGIGQAVARRASGFGMTILYHNRRRLPEDVESKLGATWVELDELLRNADFVSVHTPLTAETRHLISDRELRLMKPTSYLINTSRGPVVDEQAVIRALQGRWIAGAGLDVFEQEPEVPQALKDLENVVLLPHIGSASVASRTRMAVMAAQSAVAVLQGQRPLHVVNPEVYESRMQAEA